MNKKSIRIQLKQKDYNTFKRLQGHLFINNIHCNNSELVALAILELERIFKERGTVDTYNLISGSVNNE